VLGDASKISRTEALAGYTSGGALALRRDDVGVIASGRFGDFAVLDHDPMTISANRLPNVRVTETWVAGSVAWTT